MVLACDPDGGNERTLFERSAYIDLKCKTDDLIFYETEGNSYVYRISTGTHMENPYIGAGQQALGYTSQSVYVTGDDGRVTRVPIDYNDPVFIS